MASYLCLSDSMSVEPPVEGYTQYADRDPFEDATGPFFFNPKTRRAAFRATERHCNSMGIVHGAPASSPVHYTLHSCLWLHQAVLRAVVVLPPTHPSHGPPSGPAKCMNFAQLQCISLLCLQVGR